MMPTAPVVIPYQPIKVENLIKLNRVAALAHLALFAYVYFWSTKTVEYRLHMDSTFYSRVPTPAIYSSMVGPNEAPNMLICDLAESNFFSPGPDTTLQLTQYPKTTDIYISINSLVMSFFILSAIFQMLGVELFSKIRSRWIGHSPTGEIKQLYHEMFDTVNTTPPKPNSTLQNPLLTKPHPHRTPTAKSSCISS